MDLAYAACDLIVCRAWSIGLYLSYTLKFQRFRFLQFYPAEDQQLKKKCLAKLAKRRRSKMILKRADSKCLNIISDLLRIKLKLKMESNLRRIKGKPNAADIRRLLF